ncbi:MAG: MBL fold metallo-hydrolase, partial [Steroidobacteraceae bacterium]
MTYRVDRRGFLTSIVGGATAASLGTFRLARAGAPAPTVEAVKLTDALTLFTGAGANVVAARDAEGLALVDGGLAARSPALLKSIQGATGLSRVHTLFNTHWHPCQTGSNESIGKEHATIIAHENTRLWLGYANPVPEHNRTYGPLPPYARPNKTFYNGTQEIRVGGEPVEYGYLLQAHTDGDIYVHFKKSNVLAAGGVVSGRGWPIIDVKTGGWIVGMVTGLQRLLQVADDQTKIIPANGPVLTRAQLAEHHQMFATIAQRLQRAIRKGLGPEEVLALDPTKEFNAEWGDPTQFTTMAFQSLWGHFAPDA